MDDLAVAHEHRPLDDVLQLADVAGPVVADERVDRRRRDALDLLAVIGRELLDEVVGEQQDVGLPLAQRRDEDGEDVEAVEQILPQRAVRDRRLHVLVGGGDQPDVDLDRLGAAEPLELALLQRAQQLDLRGEVTSPISSRRSVPPSASSKRPFLRCSAPVNAPFS